MFITIQIYLNTSVFHINCIYLPTNPWFTEEIIWSLRILHFQIGIDT